MNAQDIDMSLERAMYWASHEELTESQVNYLLDLLDKQQKIYIAGSTGWIVIEAFKDYVKDRS